MLLPGMFPNRFAWPPEYPSVVSCEPCAVVRPPGVVAVPVLMFTETPPGAIPRLSARRAQHRARRVRGQARRRRPARERRDVRADPVVVAGDAAGLDARGRVDTRANRQEHAARRAAGGDDGVPREARCPCRRRSRRGRRGTAPCSPGPPARRRTSRPHRRSSPSRRSPGRPPGRRRRTAAPRGRRRGGRATRASWRPSASPGRRSRRSTAAGPTRSGASCRPGAA